MPPRETEEAFFMESERRRNARKLSVAELEVHLERAVELVEQGYYEDDREAVEYWRWVADIYESELRSRGEVG